MACPARVGTYETYQIFAAFANATVPNGNISSCVGFDAITEVYNGTEAGVGVHMREQFASMVTGKYVLK
jgi:hypothetical protein